MRCRLNDVVAQRRARHRLPVAVDVERLDLLAQPVERQRRADAEVHARGRVDRQLRRFGELDDVGLRSAALRGSPCACASASGTFAARYCERRLSKNERSAPDEHARQRGVELREAASQPRHLALDFELAG